MRLLLLMGPETYRATDFVEAASELPLSLVVGTAAPLALADDYPDRYLQVDLYDPASAVATVRDFHARHRIDVVVPVDDEGVVCAAAVTEALGLPHNTLAATQTAHDKLELRECLTQAGLRQPWCVGIRTADPVAEPQSYPVVVKLLRLAASRGVIRADNRAQLETAVERLAKILQEPDAAKRAGPPSEYDALMEQYLPGEEVAVEAVVRKGELHVLAIFDKPDPLEGPFFEETLYVTPSRHDEALQEQVVSEVRRAVEAVGLTRGPVHAELRIDERGPWIIEIAPRTIGGLCGRVLRFGAGMSLEELVLREAAGLAVPTLEREQQAAGVLMIPIPRAGRLQGVQGIEAARAVEHVVDVVQTIPDGHDVVPLPEGRRYFGFAFARADTPEQVEKALRSAHSRLEIDIRS